LVLSTKPLVAAAKFLVAATKILFVVPNFVAVTKPFFFREAIFVHPLQGKFTLLFVETVIFPALKNKLIS